MPAVVDAPAVASLLPPRLDVEAAGVVPAAGVEVVVLLPNNPPLNNPPDGAAGADPVAPVAPVEFAAGAAVVPCGSAGLGGRPNRPPVGAADGILISGHCSAAEIHIVPGVVVLALVVLAPPNTVEVRECRRLLCVM